MRSLQLCGPVLFALSVGCSHPPAQPAASPAQTPQKVVEDAPPTASAPATAPAPVDTTDPATVAPIPGDVASAPLSFPVDPAALAEIKSSPVVTTGKLSMLFSECSGAGGIHTIFEVSSPVSQSRVLLAHGGGHGQYALPGLTSQNSMMLAGRRVVVGDRWFVLGLRPAQRSGSRIAGWCVDNMPGTDLDVVASIPVPNLAAAQQLVASIASSAP